MNKELTDKDYARLAASLSGETSESMKDSSLLDEESQMKQAWDGLKRMELPVDVDVDKAWNKVERRIEDDSRREIRISLLKVAAVAVAVIASVWFIVNMANSGIVIVTTDETDSNYEVLLSDGSKIVLNRNTTVSYSRSFNKERSVTLSGEAFFEVARDEDHPFTVMTDMAEITVLGTSFNVITENGNEETEVFVESGRVQVSSNFTDNVITLSKDFVCKVSEKYTAEELNTNLNYLSWNTRLLRYNGEQLDVVFADLKRLYNIDIVTNDEAINTFTLTSVFDNQPEDMIIKLLCTTFGLDYTNRDNTYVLSLQ